MHSIVLWIIFICVVQGTLFAPNDRAVNSFLASNGLNLEEVLEQGELLKALLSFFIADEVSK